MPIAFGCCYGGYGRGTFSVAAPARIQLQLSASAILRSCHSSIGCHSHTLAHALLKLFEFLDLEWKFTSFFLADAECACAFKRNSGKPTLVSTGVGKMKEKYVYIDKVVLLQSMAEMRLKPGKSLDHSQTMIFHEIHVLQDCRAATTDGTSFLLQLFFFRFSLNNALLFWSNFLYKKYAPLLI